MIYISVVSHGHEAVIEEFGCLDSISKLNNLSVILKDNKASGVLKEKYKNNPNIHVLEDEPGIGFGANNNYIFNYCRNKLGASDSDYFLIMNPDVKIDQNNYNKLLCQLESNQYPFATINLYKNLEDEVYDYCVRKFPTFINFIESFAFGRNKTSLDKRNIVVNTHVDWAAGSFLIIKFSHYRHLLGFDENYFMYCEDIDLCYRYMQEFNDSLIFIPSVKALHDYRKDSKKILSKHFFWHIKSMLNYLIRKNLYNFKVKSRVK
ncbi:glycosyltransferase family 2 protein [Citrobacter portucalensis]|uniref:glycosyltransferase family 2 protein n=1 Tax=Citrobacter portucalensis TaxID=1639133 RepID=UPI000C21D3DD|nr:glycosyltransferase family 2 protein [Citrobacter portucalensis]ATX92613.1 hypothetical protein AM348_13805 [Citrobacter freundii]AVD78994.1 glycosyl transferase family 2 [Citrobacter freundii]EIP1107602.1 glycosyltransferase family 2 protein [Citrobacter freundii]WOR31694.1 glycosyltransferase family 2 protein [Citrobacter portucalensis]